ncbi:MAG: hypothetical protein HY898_27075 [Deltaproteobacteria bacterium]|nr:hypothetical protein [Deltaproteobacteria bacterium]
MRIAHTFLLGAGSVALALLVTGCSSGDSTAVNGSGGSKDGGTGGSAGKQDGGMGGSAGSGASKDGGAGGALINPDGGGVGGGGGQGSACTPGTQHDCYTGPQGTEKLGTCKSGKATCAADGKTWGACTGQVVPEPDSCLDALDNDCNGIVNDGNHTAPGCACVPGTTKCENDHERVCDANGDWGPAGAECCKAGQFSCDCNQVMKCDVGPPPHWVPMSPALICDTATAKKCDAATGTCKTLTTTGANAATGTYYQYAVFEQSAGVFKGGYDVDSEGDLLYVNRGGSYLDVYKVELQDSDGDGKLEANQHPNNPLETGPIEKRVLTFVTTYGVVNDKAPMGPANKSEILAASDRIFSLGPVRNGDITEYLFATKATNVVVHPTKTLALSHMGYGAGDGLWYGSNESARRVYSYCPSAKQWVAEFQYPDLAGSHMDGLEAIVSFSTGVQYVYVSDMTSDFIGQYRRDSKGGWIQENLFKYADGTGSVVEGMGYGALHHFWATGGDVLYEIGGGDLTGYLQ